VANPPRYPAIVDHYRREILEGRLTVGERLPSVEAMAELHNVAKATINRAIGELIVERLVRTTPRGTFVSDAHQGTLVGLQRIARVRREQPYLVDGEFAFVSAAEIVTPPLYIADLYDLEPGAKVLRREYVVRNAERPMMLVVDWMRQEGAAAVPDLLTTKAGVVNQAHQLYLDAIGRTIEDGRDDIESREGSQRETGHLQLRRDSPVLAHVTRVWDADGIILYSEHVLPPKLVIGYRLAKD